MRVHTITVQGEENRIFFEVSKAEALLIIKVFGRIIPADVAGTIYYPISSSGIFLQGQLIADDEAMDAFSIHPKTKAVAISTSYLNSIFDKMGLKVPTILSCSESK